MKHEIYISIASIFIVLLLSVGIFYSPLKILERTYGLTGNVIFNDSEDSEIKNLKDFIPKDIDSEQALNFIYESEKIIKEMEEEGFSTIAVNDLLNDAKRTHEQAQYAEILRGNYSQEHKTNARKELRLIEWEKIYYNNVQNITNKIKSRKDKAFYLRDSIELKTREVEGLKGELNSFGFLKSEEINTNESQKLIKEIQTAFNEERYEEADVLLLKLRDVIEEEKTKTSILSSLKSGSQTFIQKYWIGIIIFTILFIFLLLITYKSIKRKSLKRKIKKMKSELIVLENLMKKAQKDRFVDFSISGIVYNIKIKKYKDRIEEINEKLPVLESRLNKKNSIIKKPKKRKIKRKKTKKKKTTATRKSS